MSQTLSHKMCTNGMIQGVPLGGLGCACIGKAAKAFPSTTSTSHSWIFYGVVFKVKGLAIAYTPFVLWCTLQRLNGGITKTTCSESSSSIFLEIIYL